MDQNGGFLGGGGGSGDNTVMIIKWELWEDFSFKRKILKPCIPAQQDRQALLYK